MTSRHRGKVKLEFRLLLSTFRFQPFSIKSRHAEPGKTRCLHRAAMTKAKKPKATREKHTDEMIQFYGESRTSGNPEAGSRNLERLAQRAKDQERGPQHQRGTQPRGPLRRGPHQRRPRKRRPLTRTSPTRISPTRTSAAPTSQTRTYFGRTSLARTSTERASSRRTSTARPSPARSSPTRTPKIEIIELTPEYVAREYGVTPKQLAAAKKRIARDIAAERRAGRLTEFTGTLTPPRRKSADSKLKRPVSTKRKKQKARPAKSEQELI